MKVDYQIEENLDPKEFLDLLHTSTLGERRPVDDMERIESMIKNADLTITARVKGKLVGVARSISDFVYATYLSDLAVDLDYQKKGIGKELIRQTKLASPKATLILLSAPAAVDYYPKVGMYQFGDCFLLKDISKLSD